MLSCIHSDLSTCYHSTTINHDYGRVQPPRKVQHSDSFDRQKRDQDGSVGQSGHHLLELLEEQESESCSQLHSTLPFHRVQPSQDQNRSSMDDPYTSHFSCLQYSVKLSRFGIFQAPQNRSNGGQERYKFHPVDDHNQPSED